jgi:hypothetical protein
MIDFIKLILRIIFYLMAISLALPFALIRLSWMASSILLENLFDLDEK